MEVKEIKMNEISLSEYNTRKDLNAGTEDTGLEDLAKSIRENGLLNPIIVMKKDESTYELIVGQRRFLACQKLEWDTIPAIIRDFTDDIDATIISLIENVHRADMNPLDKARAYQRINEKYNDLKKVVKVTGVSVQTIRKYLKLLNLAPSIQEKLSTTNGPAGIATLAKIADTFSLEDQEKALERVGGFKQQIQLEIIKKSDGDLSKLERLRAKAFEGAFNSYLCKSLDDCQFIPKELIHTVRTAIREFEETGIIQEFKETIEKLK